MSYILFIDESGGDQRDSPYEVLAGITVEDRQLWSLIKAVNQTEVECFGRRYSSGPRELKGKKTLKKKVFKHASQKPPLDPDTRRTLARQCLDRGDQASGDQLTALGQAKLAFVEQTLQICLDHRCKAFASIVPRGALRPAGGNSLRKDYSYLFERFFYYLEDISPQTMGLIVFDELDRSRSHLLIDQMTSYFLRSSKGRSRAGQIVPEPFFVHSDLTTAIQLADFIAYLISWGIRLPRMVAPARDELSPLGRLVLDMRYRTTREIEGNPNFNIWSFSVIDDLRPSREGP